nr:O-antigen ligase family protein [Microbacterium esteraromaticum]
MDRSRGRSRRLFAVGFAVVLVAVAVMTGSRGPAIAAALSLVIAVSMAPMFGRRRVRTLVGVGALGAVTVLVVASEGNAGFNRILSFLNGESDTSSGARTLLWESAWQGLIQHPLGQGWGSFAPLGGANLYPHNLLLEIGYELGVIPAAVTIIVIVAAVAAAARRATDVSETAFFALLMFSIFNAMVSSDVNGSRMMVVTLFAAWSFNEAHQVARTMGARTRLAGQQLR